MFVGDHVSRGCPEAMRAIDAANIRGAVAYGGDGAANDLDRACSGYFETLVTAFPAGNGTAANALVLAFATPRFAAIYCHQATLSQTTACGASGAWAGSSKLVQLGGEQFCIDADTLRSALVREPRGRPQSAPPAVVSLTQGIEARTVYSLEQITSICRVAHDNGLLVRMDGARFSKAPVLVGSSPTAMSWRTGIVILSYGAWMCANGVVSFDRDPSTQQRGFLRRRNAH
jgi:threonine aldolase